MTPDDFDHASFTPDEVDCAWHIYAALLTYGMQNPGAMESPRFLAAMEQQKFMFDRLFERMER